MERNVLFLTVATIVIVPVDTQEYFVILYLQLLILLLCLRRHRMASRIVHLLWQRFVKTTQLVYFQIKQTLAFVNVSRPILVSLNTY